MSETSLLDFMCEKDFYEVINKLKIVEIGVDATKALKLFNKEKVEEITLFTDPLTDQRVANIGTLNSTKPKNIDSYITLRQFSVPKFDFKY